MLAQCRRASAPGWRGGNLLLKRRKFPCPTRCTGILIADHIERGGAAFDNQNPSPAGTGQAPERHSASHQSWRASCILSQQSLDASDAPDKRSSRYSWALRIDNRPQRADKYQYCRVRRSRYRTHRPRRREPSRAVRLTPVKLTGVDITQGVDPVTLDLQATVDELACNRARCRLPPDRRSPGPARTHRVAGGATRC